MATYTIGDVHGCPRTLRRLFDTLPFDYGRDRLWLVGDVVAHGPDSVGVLRTLRDLDRHLGDRLALVLGNHDLRLIAAREGVKVPRKVAVLLETVRAEREGEELLDFLASHPLFHVENGFALVHAGLLPAWTVAEARERADEVAAILSSSRRSTFLNMLYDRDRDEAPDTERLSQLDRAVRTARVMTTIRALDREGTLSEFNLEPERAPPEICPWFASGDRAHRDTTIVFGHWAALGLRQAADWIALDSGCAWGGPLSAMRLEDRRVFQTPRVD